MSTPTHDVVVIGLGAHGSATLYQLARQGVAALGIDRFQPPHTQGASHGETRITRLAVGEGPHYVPWVARSHQIWRELHAQTGQQLYHPTGGLVLGSAQPGHNGADFLSRTVAIAQRHGIAHELLDAAALRARFPQFQVTDEARAYFEPEAGHLTPEACIQVQLQQAQRLGARLQLGETVETIERDGNAVRVRTSRATYLAAKAVVTAGPWIPALVGGAFQRRLTVRRQVLHWFRATQPQLHQGQAAPVFIWQHGPGEDDHFYGFPAVNPAVKGAACVKVATAQRQHATTPDTVDRQVLPQEQAAMFARHVQGRLRGVTAECVRSAACLYTVSDDGGFIVDRHPTLPQVTVVSACSGHGFKHSAGLGEALAQQLQQDAVLERLRPFGLDRFQ
jgi:sarcosine oxidase